jgi:hypothetical protein
MSEIFKNRVSDSGIITLDLEDLVKEGHWASFDLKPFLFMELILKEKDFREALKNHDWSVYHGTNVAVFCSADAIIPMWAYMLIGSYLSPVAGSVVFGTLAEAKDRLLLQKINEISPEQFAGKRVVVKGCGDEPISEAAYLAATVKLQPVVKSIMYGEPCSTVPIYKQKLV